MQAKQVQNLTTETRSGAQLSVNQTLLHGNICRATKMDGLMTRFYALCNNTSVISGCWPDDNQRVCNGPPFTVEKILPQPSLKQP